jgi:hypothetical protein
MPSASAIYSLYAGSDRGRAVHCVEQLGKLRKPGRCDFNEKEWLGRRSGLLLPDPVYLLVRTRERAPDDAVERGESSSL